MTDAAALPAERTTYRPARFWDEYRVEMAMLGALVLLSVALSFAADNFLTERNLRNVMWQSTAIGIVAIGQTLVILTAGIDLSVGGMAAVSAMVGGKVMLETNVAFGIVATILVATFIGLVNGVFVAYGKLAPFIVTLGVMSICTSLTYVISDQASITGLPDSYRKLGRGLINLPIRDGGFAVQYYILVFIALYAMGHIMLTRAKPGRFIYAIGSNEEAARLSGVNVRAYKTMAYVLCGFLCGIAALILSGRLGVIDPDNGSGWELQSIAAVVIGGTSLFGGKGSLVGTLIGVFLIGVLNNGLNLLRVSSFWQGTAVGAVIILSVLLERIFRNRGA
ncbi:MAG TPA: ABC transporter permease [Thermomicrobiales bacterium]|nr:ABC transporter permease [Thermomicrobiales bacterium]